MHRTSLSNPSFFFTIVLNGLFGFCTSFSIHAAEITEEQALSFGTIAVIDNHQSAQLRILSNGTQVTDPNLIVLEPGQVGRYFLYDFPASTLLNISLSGGSTASTFTGGGPVNQFSIEPYLDHATYYTNQFGELTLLVPGLLKTSGDGSTYSDGDYYRYFEIIIDY
jgi:hypothetical protein